MSVNDPHVLQTFAEELDVEERMIFISDFSGELTKNLHTEF